MPAPQNGGGHYAMDFISALVVDGGRQLDQLFFRKRRIDLRRCGSGDQEENDRED